MSVVIPTPKQLIRHRAILVLLDQRFNTRIAPPRLTASAMGGLVFVRSTKRDRVSCYTVGNEQSGQRFGAPWRNDSQLERADPLPYIPTDHSWYLIESDRREFVAGHETYCYLLDSIINGYSKLSLWPMLCRMDAPVWTLKERVWNPHKDLRSV